MNFNEFFFFQNALSEARSVVSFVQGMNFSLTTTFNVCLLCDPLYLRQAIEAITEGGGSYSLGFIHQQDYPAGQGA